MISSTGDKEFCTGGDVAVIVPQNTEGSKAIDFFALEYRLNHLVTTYTKPYIAVMDGIIMGGGVGLSTFYAGMATHYLHSSVLGNLTARLSELVFKDYASLRERLEIVNKTMAEFSTGLPCFKHNAIEDILEALKQETENKERVGREDIEDIILTLPNDTQGHPPPAPPGEEMDDLRSVPARASYCCSLYEPSGFLKARLLSKPPTQPIWKPDTLEAVTSKDVDFFLNIPEDQTRLPLLSSVDYPAYPHAHYSLPSEAEIEKFVRDNSISRKQTVNEFFRKWGQKEGVREKVAKVLARRTAQVK
ncbi:hypothetical protein Egran_06363, partial [Elaphomyces granulatus]